MDDHKKARKLRASRPLPSGHKQKQLFTQRFHLSHLLGQIKKTARFPLLILAGNFCMASEQPIDPGAQSPSGLSSQQINISIIDSQFDVVMLPRQQQTSPDTVDNTIPLGPPSDPEVAAKASPKANQTGSKANNAAVRVNPGSEFSWIHWLSFWGLCLFLGFALSQIVAPRQK